MKFVLLVLSTIEFVFCYEVTFFNVTRVLNSGDIFLNSPNAGLCHPTSCNIYQALSVESNRCHCQCPITKPVFFQNLRLCSDTVDTCHIINFIRFNRIHNLTMTIPAIFLPPTDQIINPNWFPNWNGSNIETDLNGVIPCNVTGMFYLTNDGWVEKPNLFSLLNVNGYTYLQWVGTRQDQTQFIGKVLQISIQCEIKADLCFVFRIIGNEKAVVSASKAWLTSHEYKSNPVDSQLSLVIGTICGTVMTLTMLGGALIWLVCWRKQKRRETRKIHLHIMNQRRLEAEAENRMNQFYNEVFSYPINDFSIRETDCFNYQNDTPSTSIALDSNSDITYPDHRCIENEQLFCPMMYSCLAQINRKRLNFSPEFLKPECMVHPPVEAEQFLFDVRQMMFIAKSRIRTKRYQPKLAEICEENEFENETKEESIHKGNVNEKLTLADNDSPSTLRSLDDSANDCSTANNDSSESTETVHNSHDSGFEEDSPSIFFISTSDKVDHWLSKFPKQINNEGKINGQTDSKCHSNLFHQFCARQKLPVQRCQVDNIHLKTIPRLDVINKEIADKFTEVK